MVWKRVHHILKHKVFTLYLSAVILKIFIVEVKTPLTLVKLEETHYTKVIRNNELCPSEFVTFYCTNYMINSSHIICHHTICSSSHIHTLYSMLFFGHFQKHYQSFHSFRLIIWIHSHYNSVYSFGTGYRHFISCFIDFGWRFAKTMLVWVGLIRIIVYYAKNLHL